MPFAFLMPKIVTNINWWFSSLSKSCINLDALPRNFPHKSKPCTISNGFNLDPKDIGSLLNLMEELTLMEKGKLCSLLLDWGPFLNDYRIRFSGFLNCCLFFMFLCCCFFHMRCVLDVAALYKCCLCMYVSVCKNTNMQDDLTTCMQA